MLELSHADCIEHDPGDSGSDCVTGGELRNDTTEFPPLDGTLPTRIFHLVRMPMVQCKKQKIARRLCGVSHAYNRPFLIMETAVVAVVRVEMRQRVRDRIETVPLQPIFAFLKCAAEGDPARHLSPPRHRVRQRRPVPRR